MERRWHTAGPALAGAAGWVLLAIGPTTPPFVVSMLTLAAAGSFGAMPTFWTIPATFLKGAGGGWRHRFISTLGAVGGFVSPTVIGWIVARTGAIALGQIYLAGLLALSAMVTSGPGAAAAAAPGARRTPRLFPERSFMPHLVVEYTANLGTEAKIPVLLRGGIEALTAEGYPLAGMRARGLRIDEYVLADGARDYVMVHGILKVAPGHSPEKKQRSLRGDLRADEGALRGSVRRPVLHALGRDRGNRRRGRTGRR